MSITVYLRTMPGQAAWAHNPGRLAPQFSSDSPRASGMAGLAHGAGGWSLGGNTRSPGSVAGDRRRADHPSRTLWCLLGLGDVQNDRRGPTSFLRS